MNPNFSNHLVLARNAEIGAIEEKKTAARFIVYLPLLCFYIQRKTFFEIDCAQSQSYIYVNI